MAGTNPFVYGEIVPSDAFLDREDERRQLARDLLDGQKVFLVAPRRYGKSSLIGVVLRDLESRRARTLALTITQFATYRAFLEAFAESCLRVAGLGARVRELIRTVFSLRPELSWEAQPTGGQELTLRFEPGRSSKEDQRLAREVFALPGLLAERTGAPWVVALDEFQKISDFDGNSVEDALRAAVQTQRRVGYVFSGSEPSLMARMLRTRRPFYKAGPVLTLSKMPPRVFVDALVERFGATGFHIDREVAAELVERAQNVPYDVQRLAHELWDDAERLAARRIASPMLQATTFRLLSAQHPILEAAWQRLTLTRRAVLRAVAREDGRNLLAAPVRVRYGLGAKSSVQRALDGLARDEWIAREAGQYVFVDSLYREYVLRETR